MKLSKKSLADTRLFSQKAAPFFLKVGLAVCCLLVLPAMGRAWCVYANPEYSEYNRLLKVDVIRFDVNVGEIRYSRQFSGYYVRCKKGGIPKKNFFARARDARWAACDRCY